MKNINDKEKSLNYYMSLPYSIRILPEEAGGYFAEIEELPGCMTQGDTKEEVLKNIEEAKELWLESALEIGKEVPLPRDMERYSGKFLVRIPKSLHKNLAELAEKEKISLNQLVVHLLSERGSLSSIVEGLRSIEWAVGNLCKRLSTLTYKIEAIGEKLPAEAEKIYQTIPEIQRKVA